MPSAKELIEKFDTLEKESERTNMEILWQDITDYVIPRKNNIIVKKQKGSQHTQKAFDSTAIHSNDLLASSLQGALTSNSVLWAKVRLAGNEFDDDEEVKEWLDADTRIMYRAFNDSNYRLEIHEMFLDVTSVGTACLLIEENKINKPGFNGLMFRAYFVKDFVIEENSEGIVDTLIRKIFFKPRQAEQRFGSNAGKKVLKALKDNSNDDFAYLHVVMPVKDYGGRLANSRFDFTDIYVSLEDEEIVSEGGYLEFPYVVPRWAKASGEKYGRSPSFNALPDIKTLNALVAYMLQALAKDANPSRLVPEGLGVTINDVPGTNIAVPAHLIEAIKKGVLTSEARWEVSVEERQELRRAIKEVYFTDQIQIQKQAQMTATESTITFELMQRLLGPIFGRMEVEIFTPLVERVFGIMLRAGAFPAVPPQITENLEIQYVGPLARSQKMSEVGAVQKWIEGMIPIASVKPEILDVPDWDEIVKDTGRLIGINEKYINNDDVIEDMRDARQKQMEEAQMTEEMKVGADAVSKIAKLGAGGGR